MPGIITIERTAKNVTGTDTECLISVDTEKLKDWSMNAPRHLSVPANSEASFAVTIDAQTVPLGEIRHGKVSLRCGRQNRLHLPVTIVRDEADVAMSKSCTPLDVPVSSTTDCTITLQNNSTQDAAISVAVQRKRHRCY